MTAVFGVPTLGGWYAFRFGPCCPSGWGHVTLLVTCPSDRAPLSNLPAHAPVIAAATLRGRLFSSWRWHGHAARALGRYLGATWALNRPFWLALLCQRISRLPVVSPLFLRLSGCSRPRPRPRKTLWRPSIASWALKMPSSGLHKVWRPVGLGSAAPQRVGVALGRVLGSQVSPSLSFFLFSFRILGPGAVCQRTQASSLQLYGPAARSPACAVAQ